MGFVAIFSAIKRNKSVLAQMPKVATLTVITFAVIKIKITLVINSSVNFI